MPAHACIAHFTSFAAVQVPRDVNEEVLRPLFQPYGEIEHISILRTQRGQSAGGCILLLDSLCCIEGLCTSELGFPAVLVRLQRSSLDSCNQGSVDVWA